MSSNNTAISSPAAAPSSPAPAPSPDNKPTPTPTPTPTPSPSPPPASSPAPASTPQPASTPSPAPSSNSPTPPKSSAAAPSSPIVTVTASTPTPSVEIRTSLVVVSGSTAPATVVVTIGPSGQATGTNAHATSTGGTDLQNVSKNQTSGLSTGGKTAIAVVIPVVVVALLVLGALFFWRKRKQRKSNEDERRKEVEEYGYNPNHDPTLPTMAEDESGYRGWGNTQTSSNRKASTTLTSGMTYSDSNSNPGGYGPVSPIQAYSEANSNDMLMRERHEGMDGDGIGALGAAGGAAPHSTNNASGIRRGPSNASSSYSMGDHSEHSTDFNNISPVGPEYYGDQNNHGYYQPTPYGNHDPYAGGNEPVIRDVSARRNTRIEKPSVFPQQGNSGIAQNF